MPAAVRTDTLGPSDGHLGVDVRISLFSFLSGYPAESLIDSYVADLAAAATRASPPCGTHSCRGSPT